MKHRGLRRKRHRLAHQRNALRCIADASFDASGSRESRGVLGSKPYRFVHLRFGFGELLLFRKNQPEIEVGLFILGITFNGLAKEFLGLLVVALIGSKHAEADKPSHKLRVQPKGLAKFGFRFLGLRQIHPYEPQGTVGDRHAGLVLQCEPEFGSRGWQLLRTNERRTQRVMSLAGLRFELHSPLKGGERAALITVLFEPGAGLAIHFGGRLIPDGLLEARRRLALPGQLRRERSSDGRKKKSESQRKLHGKPRRSISDLDPAMWRNIRFRMGASQRNRTESDSRQNTNLQVKNLRAAASHGGMTAIGVFLIFGAVMAFVAGISLTITRPSVRLVFGAKSK